MQSHGFVTSDCNNACFYRLLHAFTGYCMLLLAMHAFTGYCMLLQAIACFYWLLHAFTGYCMLLQAIAGLLMQAFACYAGHVCMLAFVSTFQTRQWCMYTCIVDIQFCNVFVLNNILRQYFFLEWTWSRGSLGST